MVIPVGVWLCYSMVVVTKEIVCLCPFLLSPLLTLSATFSLSSVAV